MNAATTIRRILLTGVACAAIAACSDTDIDSPGSEVPVAPPSGGGGGGGGGTVAIDLVPAGGCPSGLTTSTATTEGTDVTACTISGNILSDITIPSGLSVAIQGPTFIGQDTGQSGGGSAATLTVQAGAVLFGQAGSDYIVVTRGSDIVADGSATNPIRFTSAQAIVDAEEGNPRDGSENNRAEWGGLVINGFAPINACIDGAAAGGTVDCVKSGEGASGLFGGDQAGDDSGTLRYARVEYAGFRVNDQDELNGIAFQGVGNGTTAEFIQVHNNEDDGIEFFGGTINAKHLVLTGVADDSVDWTDGFTGNLQFIVIQQSDDDGDQGFELDNEGDDNTLLPRSNPTVSNFTAIGEQDIGILYRAGTSGILANGIVTGFPDDGCLDIDDSETFAVIGSTGVPFRSVYLSCPTTFVADDEAATTQEIFERDPNNASGPSTLAGLLPGAQEEAVEAFDVTGVDAFFDSVDYIGAIDPDATEENNPFAGWTIGLFSAPACPSGTTATGETIGARQVCRLTGNQTSDLRLVRGDALIYELVGPVFIGVDAGPDPASPLPSGITATLTIDAGVTVFGSSGSDYIVVARGSEIQSNGTVDSPVIMTGRADVEGTVNPNDRGLWGGLVINGRAPINACIDGAATGGTIDCEKSGEGASGLFGGATNDDDSGNLFFTQVKHAGFRVNDQDELNGIAFQAVGNSTEVDSVQVHNNEDDGIEFFGGTVDAKRLVLTGVADDSVDWTDGYVGRLQFILIQQAADDGDQGFELDNEGDDNTLLPRSNPTVSNFTALGQRDTGILYRAGTSGILANGIISGFPREGCIDIDDSETFAVIGSTGVPFRSVFLSCPTAIVADDEEATQLEIFQRDPNNTTGTASLAGFSFLTETPSGLIPAADGPESAVTPWAVPDDGFFESVDFIGGASPTDNWYLGWTFVQQ